MSARGKLRVYLGAAPGVGKTYHMLDEAQRRAERGGDVVVGFVETHDRPHTQAMLDGLEIVPRRRMEYRGSEFEEMDIDAVLERRPSVVLIDELAHTNIPGSRNPKRWQDVEDLLAAGIDVIASVNVQHLESLNDVVQKITGVPQRETVPDEVVRSADQIELIDMAPEALRRRMAHGNIYKPEKIDAALSNYFRPGNLGALRELALLWVAGRVDEALQHYRDQHGIDKVWETRERVVVALTGGPEGSTLIRRGARIAQRLGAKGSDLLAVHVARSDGLTGASPALLAEQRELVESLGGTFHSVVGDDIPNALLQFARAENATQLVVGVSRRGRLERFLGGYGIGETVVQQSGDIDVHMVTHERSAAEQSRLAWIKRVARQPETGPRWWGPVAGLVVPIVLTMILASLRSELNLTNQVLIFLAGVVAVARLGGLLSAFFASLTASLLLNYYFIRPLYRLTINDPQNIVALVVFALVALIVASVVDFASRQERRAGKASAEAETLSELARSVLRGDEAIGALLGRFRETFGMESVALLERVDPSIPVLPDEADDPEAWRIVAATSGSGTMPCRAPGEGDVVVQAGPDAMLVLRGRALPAADQHVLTAFAAQAAVALERSRLARQAAEAVPLAAADKMRTALLAAVSHDLRTPLAAAKLSVASLRDTTVEWSEQDRAELLAGAEESLDRLSRLVENLLDMSRLQAGALNLRLEDVAVEDVAVMALDSLGIEDRSKVHFGPLSAVPDVLADPVLLERAVANLIGNALKHGSAVKPVLLTASELAGRVELRVTDRGPGIRPEDWERIFTPFQRLGDRDNTTGVGLGLALSRGLVEAMGGTLTPEETPGGGMTMVVSLPAAGMAGDEDDSGGVTGTAVDTAVDTATDTATDVDTAAGIAAEEPAR
ncbi:two-component system sensor histidine kinase KdpD [Catenulispora sp. GP43]|uniref:ATP-binding protein n=1 Tax=Catenulispora sp. GP43 TaxID=3156263 RepID=UPI0035180E01